ncbi:MAG: M56 family metallopeptidase, partial [Pirellulales bacterium]|nr:M56 family metallopeptidase [Pirellulales bacterium]
MTSWLPQIDALWPLAGWTMLHFLWFGVAVAVAGGGLRLACRRAAPNVRYAASLTTLAALAVAPAIIAAWLHVHAPPTAWQGRALPGDHAALGQGLRYLEPTPGQSPALPGAAPIVIDLAREAPLANPASPPPSRRRGGVGGGVSPAADIAMNPAPSANPSPGPSLRGRGIVDAVILFLPWIWLVGAPLTFALLAAGLIGSDRLRRRGTPIVSGAPYEACQRLQTALRITRRVSLAACDCVAQPVLIGIVRPLVLLPAAALSGWTPEELQMVLVHELAHVRRWDNLVNLVQRIIESLLFFHPAVWLVSRQVRRDREECCDAVVVRHTGRRREYAELLLGIAAAVPRGQAPRLTSGAFAAYSPMASHPLAGRIRRILTIEEEPMGITRRTLAAMIGLPLVAVAATVYTAAADEEASNPPPSKAGARGGIATPAAAPSPTEQPKPATQPEPAGQQSLKTQYFTFTQSTKNSDIDKLAHELHVMGKQVEIRMNSDDGTVTLLVKEKIPPTPADKSQATSGRAAAQRQLSPEQRKQLEELAQPGDIPAAIMLFPVSGEEVSRRIRELNLLGHAVRVSNGDGFTVLFIKDYEATKRVLARNAQAKKELQTLLDQFREL